MSEPTPENWKALVAEFRRRPLGRHTADLQELLNKFRAEPITGKPFLFMLEQHRKWALGWFSDTKPLTYRVDRDTVFTRIEDAEWHVFRLRWQKHFGFDPAQADAS